MKSRRLNEDGGEAHGTALRRPERLSQNRKRGVIKFVGGVRKSKQMHNGERTDATRKAQEPKADQKDNPVRS